VIGLNMQRTEARNNQDHNLERNFGGNGLARFVMLLLAKTAT
jgi:hypothetical protein